MDAILILGMFIGEKVSPPTPGATVVHSDPRWGIGILTRVAEPQLELEPVKPKFVCGTGTGAISGAVISYFGSGSTAPEPKLSFL